MIQAHNLNNLIKEPTSFQSNNPSQIELILTNQESMYKFSNTFETGLPYHDKLISTISKSGSFKGTRQMKVYIKSILKQKLNNLSSTTYDDFEETFLSLLNKHASLKEKNINGPFMTKELRKEIMNRSIKHFGKLSGHISVIKTINLLKLPLFKTILLLLMKKQLRNYEQIFYKHYRKYKFKSSNN